MNPNPPDDLDVLIAALKRALRPDAPPSTPREGYGLDTAEAIAPLAKSPHERTMAPGAWSGMTPQERNERLAMMATEAGLALASASPAGRAAVGEVAPPQSAGGKVRPSQRPGYRKKPEPTDFAARNMEALSSPEARAALRDRASDSELRYELAGLTRKDKMLRERLASKGIRDNDQEQFTVKQPPPRTDSKPEFTVEQPAPRPDAKPEFTVEQRQRRDMTLDALLQRLGWTKSRKR